MIEKLIGRVVVILATSFCALVFLTMSAYAVYLMFTHCAWNGLAFMCFALFVGTLSTFITWGIYHMAKQTNPWT